MHENAFGVVQPGGPPLESPIEAGILGKLGRIWLNISIFEKREQLVLRGNYGVSREGGWKKGVSVTAWLISG